MQQSCSSEDGHFFRLTYIMTILITTSDPNTVDWRIWAHFFILQVYKDRNSPDVLGRQSRAIKKTDNITASNFKMSKRFTTWTIFFLSRIVVKDKTLLRWLRIDESREVMSKILYLISSFILVCTHVGHSQMKPFFLIPTLLFMAESLVSVTFSRIQCGPWFIFPGSLI